MIARGTATLRAAGTDERSRVIVCGAPTPSIDKLFATASVSPGRIHRPDALVVRAGGKGLNVARAAHALGADVLAVALLAGHAGRWIAEQLEGAGVRADVVWGDGETRTSLSVAAGGTLTEFYELGDAPGSQAWERFCDRFAAAARPGAWASISGSLPPGVAPAEVGRLVSAARAAGARVAVDQHGPVLAAALAAGPDLVKVNVEEAAEVSGLDAPPAAAAAMRSALSAAGAPHAVVVVTLGADGALLDAGDARLRGAVSLRAPYPVGSGDAFLAGLLVAAPPADGCWNAALALGLGAGAANAEVPGAAAFDPARARALALRATIVGGAR